MSKIYLVRHGQYDQKDWKEIPSPYSLDDLITMTDGPLTSIGINQAIKTAELLEKLPIKQIFSSSLIRSKETARYINEKFPSIEVFETKSLWECLPSKPENGGQEIMHISPSDILKSKECADATFLEYIVPMEDTDGDRVIVCHGNLIRYFVSKILEAPVDSWQKMDISNCGVTQIEFENGKPILTAFNNNEHIPNSLKSYS